ncbi:EAL domain-containing protein [Pinisolibacter aquiterrae]|uniref:EAL domain-containing protein n=1 Tax=Pinisolibacter aquiterrae TaxID=2815579 RepID=UPI0023687ABE|nr:EAL domain-containing protein [Pinisolibacter aquiterrae]
MLPFDKIKIDQSFVKTMRENSDSRMIVKAIIGLSGSLGLPTTAEGIESSGNADILRDFGCTLGQGFLYSEAVPAQAVPGLMAEIEGQVEHIADAEGLGEHAIVLTRAQPAETPKAAAETPAVDATAEGETEALEMSA